MVDTSENGKQIVKHFWAAMQTNDFKAAGEFLHDNYILEWPQSGERIRGGANFVVINEHYPTHGRWECTVHRIIAEDDQVISDVGVTDGAITGQAITFSRIRAGKILQQTEFWLEPFEPAAWRADWVGKI